MSISTCLDNRNIPQRNQDMDLCVFIPPSPGQKQPRTLSNCYFLVEYEVWVVLLNIVACLLRLMALRYLFCLVHVVKAGITGISLGVIRTNCRFIPRKFASRMRSCLRDLGFSFNWHFRTQYFFFQSQFGEVKKNSHGILLHQFGLKNGLPSCFKPVDLIGKASFSFFCVWSFRNKFKWKLCNYQHGVCV